MASIRILVPGKTAKIYRLHKRISIIGSDAECDIVLPDPLAALSHAHVLFDGDSYHITALDKGNEIAVNGKKRQKHRLGHEDRIRIGSIELVFLLLDEHGQATEAATGALHEIDAYRKLFEFSARLMSNYDLTELLATLMDLSIQVTNADKGFLILMEGGQLDVKVARNLHKENIADAVSHLSDSIVAKVVQTKRALIISDAMGDAEFSTSKSVMDLRLTSVMCVPLLERGNLIGLVYVGNSSAVNLFNGSTLDILTVFASQASLIVRNALLVNELKLDNRALHEQLEQVHFGEITGACPSMQEVYRRVQRIAATDISVLITGETGTGKELIAREIHRRSHRAKGPFVSINCGAIPEALLESELFGHVRGAFTGAIANKPGRFHAASGGTILLDEIGEMPPALQVKILRVLQEKALVRVGDTRSEKVDIRVLAATNRNLDVEMHAGRFREDLYYRLNVVNVHLPPLRERGDDIVVIARFLLARLATEYGSRARGFAPTTITAMRKHRWPGNVRELENRLKKASVLADKALLGPEDLDLNTEVLPAVLPLAEAREKFQRDYINEVLALNQGNRTKTARDLGVDPRTIFRHLEKENAEGEEDDSAGEPTAETPGEPNS
ncbi:MAG: sigma 54-interacting transcriptional regulator [Pseudomonadota bacterium]